MKLLPRLFALLLAVVGAAGCSESAEEMPGFALQAAGGAKNLPATSFGRCEEATEKTCTVTFEQSTGTVSCFLGVQKCSDGQWSSCMEP